jgi:hypothetical protein
MYLARLIPGHAPLVAPVVDYELVTDTNGDHRKRPRQPHAWLIKAGAAAISQSPAGAVASAKGMLEREALKRSGSGRVEKPKYQRAHIA